MSWKTLLRCNEHNDQEWRRQNVSDNVLYDYINVRDTGKLVDVFKNNSSLVQRSVALNSIIRQDIVQFLYNDGKGEVVRSDRNAFASQSSVSIDDYRSINLRVSLYHFYRASVCPSVCQSLSPSVCP